jgi:hypothetical protein
MTMRYTNATAVLALALPSVGCWATHPLGRYTDPQVQEQVRALVRSDDVLVDVKARPLHPERATGHAVDVTPDGLTVERLEPWYLDIPDEPSATAAPASIVGHQLIAPRYIDSVETVHHVRGIADGFAIGGLLIGSVAGTLAYFTVTPCKQSDELCIGPTTRGGTAALVGVVYAVVGGLLGGVVGLAAGHRDAYVFAASDDQIGKAPP